MGARTRIDRAAARQEPSGSKPFRPRPSGAPDSPRTVGDPGGVLALQRSAGNRAVVQRLQDGEGKEITAEMVGKADIHQLEEWAKLDADWEDDVMPLITDRLHALRDPSSPPLGLPSVPVSTPVSTPLEVGGGPKPEPVEEPPSPEKIFEATIRAHQLKRALLPIYRVNPGLAEEVRDGYDSTGNPSLAEGLLVRLAEAGLLWRDREMYRGGRGSKSAGGQNGMIYYFYVSRAFGPSVAEWHVHWESGGRAGSPGWKRGAAGRKAGGDDVTVMKALLGSDWGKVAGSPGSRTLVGE